MSGKAKRKEGNTPMDPREEMSPQKEGGGTGARQPKERRVGELLERRELLFLVCFERGRVRGFI